MNSNVFKINAATLDTQYRGAGWAVVAHLNGEVVAIRYLADADEQLSAALDDYAESELYPAALIKTWIETPKAGALIRELQPLGYVSIGMCSGGEFVEL